MGTWEGLRAATSTAATCWPQALRCAVNCCMHAAISFPLPPLGSTDKSHLLRAQLAELHNVARRLLPAGRL